MSLERMQKARSGLIIKEPFFGCLSMRFELIEDPKCETSWTDGRRLGFNPEWAENIPMPMLEGAFAHHVTTCALGHHLRRGSRDHATWNDASDNAVNHELKNAGFELPEGYLLDPQFNGMHAEAIYAALKGQEQEDPDGDQTKPGQGEGEGEPSAGDQDGDGQPSPGGKGEKSTGAVCDATDEAGDELDEAGVQEQEQEWQTATAQAAQIARGQGKLPGGLERAVENFLNPKVDWREAVQRYFRQRSKDDYNWSRPNRRYLSQGLYLPSLDSIHAGKLVFAVDASGSIRQEVFDQFASEIEEVRSALRPEEVILLIFDTQVRQALRFGPDEPFEWQVKAGGGTAFDDPVRWLERENITPDALVYLTDLDSSVFPPEPEYPVLWVTTMKTRAPFGEVILM